ncbi:MAG: radical SAM protein [Candidatus Eiseniibacteriota bacterium]|nr:MAG: radical SAM protein [Candidatus Eisenbacteria bacterium]
MHLPVAPKCNIKCNYCDRKFDCPNEGRPGVASAILKPRDALTHLREALARDERIKVVGIAGPGEPLFNEATFETMALVREAFPTVRLCLSTNGLLLPGCVDRLAKLGVLALTVTANAITPEVAARLYSFVRYEGKLLKGLEAATLLIQKQFEGIRKAAEAGFAVKVNSVLVPGINEHEILEIAARAREGGAHLMNIIPLRPQDKLSGVRAPAKKELESLREKASSIMTQFSHCALCRADAAGLITEEGLSVFGARDFSSPECRPVTIAVASKTGESVDEHFARAKVFYLYQFQGGSLQLVEEREVGELPPGFGLEENEESEEAVLYYLELLKDCELVLCEKIGYEPRQRLRKAGIDVLEVQGETEKLAREFGYRSKRIACGGASGSVELEGT